MICILDLEKSSEFSLIMWKSTEIIKFLEKTLPSKRPEIVVKVWTRPQTFFSFNYSKSILSFSTITGSRDSVLSRDLCTFLMTDCIVMASRERDSRRSNSNLNVYCITWCRMQRWCFCNNFINYNNQAFNCWESKQSCSRINRILKLLKNIYLDTLFWLA